MENRFKKKKKANQIHRMVILLIKSHKLLKTYTPGLETLKPFTYTETQVSACPRKSNK